MRSPRSAVRRLMRSTGTRCDWDTLPTRVFHWMAPLPAASEWLRTAAIG